MEKILSVATDETDGDEFGNEWRVHFVLYRTDDEDCAGEYELYEEDDRGNGTLICSGDNERRMRNLTQRLGRQVFPQVAAVAR